MTSLVSGATDAFAAPRRNPASSVLATLSRSSPMVVWNATATLSASGGKTGGAFFGDTTKAGEAFLGDSTKTGGAFFDDTTKTGGAFFGD